MIMMSDERLHALKRLEQECYSVCLYLLEDANAAVAAAKSTLLELYHDEQFWTACETMTSAIMRRRASFHCLRQFTCRV